MTDYDVYLRMYGNGTNFYQRRISNYCLYSWVFYLFGLKLLQKVEEEEEEVEEGVIKVIEERILPGSSFSLLLLHLDSYHVLFMHALKLMEKKPRCHRSHLLFHRIWKKLSVILYIPCIYLDF